jgi:hypothetical protein
MQPKTDVEELASAISEFEALLPGWWFTIGTCSISSDASCGPDIAGPDSDLLKLNLFDVGFHCDGAKGSMASSLKEVMKDALAARRVARKKYKK